MKKIIVLLIACFAAWHSTKAAGDNAGLNAPQPAGVITFQTFYDELSPYGSWMDFPGYGYVWRPGMGSGFSPYMSNGYWISTNEGWFWNSNYQWGWAPFHYGSWFYDDFYGWLWVPDYVWAPAWVNWGYTDGYYGWAPIMPGTALGSPYYGYRPDYMYWNYVPCARVTDRRLYRAAVNRTQINNYVRNTTIINNYGTTREKGRRFNSGPEVNQVEKFTKKSIRPASIAEQQSAGATRVKGTSVTAYRPGVTRADARPSDLVEYKQPARDRKVQNNERRTQTKSDKVQGNTPATQRTNTQTDKSRRVSPSAEPAREKQRKMTPSQPSPSREQRPQPQYNRPTRPANESPKQERMQPAEPRPQPQMQPQSQPAQPAERSAPPPKRDKMGGGG